MRFKTDENLPVEAAERLREAGYNVATVIDRRLVGASDSEFAAVCSLEHRVLLTLDADFADIRTYPPVDHEGIIVLRLRQRDKLHVLATMKRLVSLLEAEPVRGRLWIVENDRLRIRE